MDIADVNKCDVYPVYRDPIHDFGILRFDPKAIKYMPLTSLDIRPDLARVGAEIRVVGNDAGEKLSILSGVISRLDRNAPEYGEGYSDFNTNYIQAAAAASGGSSGSPVVNIDGYAVALQAGGRSDGAATDYFLPLDRPYRALQCIQRGETVSRGSIQTQWILRPFDECRRLGLSPDREAEMRQAFPKETGLLVAEIVLPKGPADSLIKEGDVLINVNDELLAKFVRLDEILDSHVGQKIKVLVQRGGDDVEIELSVGDLHSITPDRFVTVAGGSFHNLSYQQARLYAIPVKGVYVCEAAGSFSFDSFESGWLIESVDQQKTPDLERFIEIMKSIRDRARVVVQYKHLRDLHTVNTKVMHVDRHWTSKMRLAVRNDTTGLWDFTEISEPLQAAPPVTRSAQFPQLDNPLFAAAGEAIQSFVRISCSMPVKLDGFPRPRKVGYGLVVDAEQGLVLVSRAIVPYDLCDISLTIADSIIVDGKVIFLHPLANYAIIKYDPSLVDAPVQTARLSTSTIKQGASTIFVGFNQNLRVVVAKTTVTDITSVAIPSNATAPRYRALNLDAITVDTNLSSQCGNGVLVNEDGTVEALWLTYLGDRSPSNKDVEYHLGLATPTLLPVLSQIRTGTIPNLRILNIETQAIQMAQARIMGVSDAWISRVAANNPSRHQLFMVRKIDCAMPGASDDTEEGDAQSLQEGDIILTLNDQLITRVSELDIMYTSTSLSALIIRSGKEQGLTVPTIPTTDLHTTHALLFCGAVLHRPHHAVRQQISKLHSEVYVSARSRGSPAYMYGLAPTNFITAVNGVPTYTLDEFLREVKKIEDNAYFRLRVVTFDNVPWVATMKKCEHYFPSMEFIREARPIEGVDKERGKVGGEAKGLREGYEWVRRVIGEEGERGKGVNGVAGLPSEIMDESEFVGGGYEGAEEEEG